MRDPIERQDAIDVLWKEREQADALMDEYLKNGYMALRADAKAERNRIEKDIAIIEDLPSAQPEQRWIPCSERLPEDVEIGEEYPTVIFCTKDIVYVGFYEYYKGGKWWTAEDYTVDNVIAWMPLPEPYREEE